MSQPPTSSPSTHSCGNVGQFANAGRFARTSGLLNTSTYAKRSPHAIKHCTVCAEKPHCGACGEPFMYRMIGLLWICSRIESITSTCLYLMNTNVEHCIPRDPLRSNNHYPQCS